MHDVKRIAEIVTEGYRKSLSGKQIARKLNKENLSTSRGKKWSQPTVSTFAIHKLGMRTITKRGSKKSLDGQTSMAPALEYVKKMDETRAVASATATSLRDLEDIDTSVVIGHIAASDMPKNIKMFLLLSQLEKSLS